MQQNAFRGRHFIFTKNNPTETLQEFFDEAVKKLQPLWLVVQLEQANTPHFQGAIGFPNARLKKSIWKELKDTHVEVAISA